MASTLVSILVHVVFSTKHREPMIPESVEPDLYAYIGAICRNHTCRLLDAGGTADHLHLLVSLGKAIALSDLLMQIKRDSSKWMKTQGSRLGAFGWQDGYGAFSIGQSQVADLGRYLAGQKEHHRTRSFKEELLALLERYHVPYDEQYLWI